MTTPFSATASPFLRASLQEREYLTRLAYQLQVDSFYPQPNRSHFDFIMCKGETVDVVESKIRSMTSDKFDSTLIEMPKYNRLKAILNDKWATRVLYIEFFTVDDVAIIYNLGKVMPPEWIRQSFVKNTVEDNGKIIKAVGYLDKKLGHKIILDK